MNLPSIIDLTKIVYIGVVTLAVVQYIKVGIPDKLIWVLSWVIGIAISFLYFYNPQVPISQMDFVAVVANGILGAVFADTGYHFVSNTNSPTFSLPSKTQINGR